MAWIAMAACLVTSTISTAGTAEADTVAAALELLRVEHPDLFTMPPLPSWPAGLQKSLRTPWEARCFTPDGAEVGEGDWLPQDRARAVQERLLYLEAYPAWGQEVVDALVPRVVAAVADATRGQDQEGWSLSEVALAGSVGVVVGAVAAAILAASLD